MTNCEIISGTYFDEDNGEYLSYGIAAEEDGEKIVVEDISVNRKLVEELRDRILKYGLSFEGIYLRLALRGYGCAAVGMNLHALFMDLYLD